MDHVEAAVPAQGTLRRGELSAFLRSRRERIRPQDVGLPVGARRRTPGLRREEVAQLAGVGVTWYTWLEQGRPIKASVQVLDAVARTLRLDAGECEHLYHLAGVPSVSRSEHLDDEVAPRVQTILDHLDPLPAAVYSARWDVLAWNAAYAMVFPAVLSWTAVERNVLCNVFTRPECCCPFADPTTEKPRLVASLRPVYGRHVGEPAWDGFVRWLRTASPAFATLWARHDVMVSDPSVKRIAHADAGELRLVATHLGLDVPETRLNVYTPADAATRDALTLLRAGEFVRQGCPEHGYVRYRNPAFGAVTDR